MAEEHKDKKSKTKVDPVDKPIDQVDETLTGKDPDLFLAEIIVEISGLSLASKRRVCKEKATEARLYSALAKIQGDRKDAKDWYNMSWTLSKLR